MKIVPINYSEIDCIETLWNDLKQHHEDRTTHHAQYYQNSTFSKRKAELRDKSDLGIYVAREGSENLGFCVVSMIATIGEVDSLYVKSERRAAGVGRLLISAGMAWLSDRKPETIRLSVGEGNEDAIAYYEKLGFKKRATLLQYFE